MTKLEIAAMITASMCSGPNVRGLSYEEIAEKALDMAEALMRAHSAGAEKERIHKMIKAKGNNEPKEPQ